MLPPYLLLLSVLHVASYHLPTTTPYHPDLTTGGGRCENSGRVYRVGDVPGLGGPCLGCKCTPRGTIICRRLRLCQPLPQPPPPGCIILHKRNTCCQQLVCTNHEKHNLIPERRSRLEPKLPMIPESGSYAQGCILNGTLYGEGSAMVSSTLCEYCYCIKGKQHCVKPQCTLQIQGCSPVFSKHSCCPVKYICTSVTNVTTTTTSSPTSYPDGCEIDGIYYPEGDKVASNRPCENCYCVQGSVQCEPIICKMPYQQTCSPVYEQGACCPTSYNCTKSGNDNTSEGSDYRVTNYIISTTLPSAGSSTHGEDHFNSNMNESEPLSNRKTEEEEEEEEEEDTENEGGMEEGDEDVEDPESNATEDKDQASTATEEHTTEWMQITSRRYVDADDDDLDTTDDGQQSIDLRNNPTIPPEIEAIINRTRSQAADYEYDYNDPSLPPSLPNLKIIPFVAADAVVNDPDDEPMYKSNDDIMSNRESPIFYGIPTISNRFSPPAETEGGFMPRDPILDGPFYESKYEKHHPSKNQLSVSKDSDGLATSVRPTSGYFSPNPIVIGLTSAPTSTTPHVQSDRCTHVGKLYNHGEVVSEPNACEICLCYTGEVVCQEPKCAPVEPGCTRHKDPGSCCGRISCGSNKTDILYAVHEEPEVITAPPTVLLKPVHTSIPAASEPKENLPENTTTDSQPDSSSIIKTVIHESSSTMRYPDSTTQKHFNRTTISEERTSSYTNNYDIIIEGLDRGGPSSSTEQIISEIDSKFNDEHDKIDHHSIFNDTSSTTTQSNELDDYKDYDDSSFSFGSVLNLLFGEDSPTTTTTRAPPILNKTEYKTIVRVISTTSTPPPTMISQEMSPNIETTTPPFETTTITEDSMESKQDLFDLGSLLDNISDDSNEILSSSTSTSTTTSIPSTTSQAPLLTTPSTSVPLTSPENNGSDPLSLLKLAGCNIYGKMYRVGRIISELSGPCLECRCTEIGVQCKQLAC